MRQSCRRGCRSRQTYGAMIENTPHIKRARRGRSAQRGVRRIVRSTCWKRCAPFVRPIAFAYLFGCRDLTPSPPSPFPLSIVRAPDQSSRALNGLALGVAVAAGETEKRRIDVLMRSFPRQVLSQANIRAVTIPSGLYICLGVELWRSNPPIHFPSSPLFHRTLRDTLRRIRRGNNLD